MDEVSACGHRFEPERFPILGPMWTGIARELADGRWHAYGDVVATLADGGANPKTVKELLRKARHAGRIEQRGAWRPRTQTDARLVRLAP